MMTWNGLANFEWTDGLGNKCLTCIMHRSDGTVWTFHCANWTINDFMIAQALMLKENTDEPAMAPEQFWEYVSQHVSARGGHLVNAELEEAA